MTHTAEIISVGTELLLGSIANTDAQDVSQALRELGINVYRHTVVGDNPERLRDAVDAAKKRADILVTTGGLGPTCDDLTKQTLCEAFGKRLLFSEAAAEEMRRYFAARLPSHTITENNYRQCMLPEGCTVFHNSCGTAPGCAFEAEGVHVLMLPGPPRECRAMLRESAVPYLLGLSDGVIFSHNVHVFGMGESAVEEKLRPLMLRLQNPTLAPYARECEVFLRVTAKASTQDAAEALCRPVLDEVLQTLGDVVYGVDTDSLENTVFGLLKASGQTLSTAESCTGGLIAKRITELPGSSAVFRGGAVTYAADTKATLLGVDEALLETLGPVSEPVARQMAEGARRVFASDLAVSVTGIAGPAGDGFQEEVGLCYVALATERSTFCRTLHLGNDRARVRIRASSCALDMVRRYLTGLPVEPKQV